MKSATALLLLVSLVNAGSATAVSNVFALGATPVARPVSSAPQHPADRILRVRSDAGCVLFMLPPPLRQGTVEICDLRSGLVKRLAAGGGGLVAWNGLTRRGTAAPRGLYTARCGGSSAIFVLSVTGAGR